MEAELIEFLVAKMGTPGLLVFAVWFIGKKLAKAYDDRIEALEASAEVCEQDRRALHSELVEVQNKFIDQLSGKK